MVDYSQFGPRRSRIAGLPRVPMPEAQDPWNDELRAKAERQRQREAIAAAREDAQAYLGSSAPPGYEAGPFGPIATKGKATDDLAAFSTKRGREKEKAESEREKASAVERERKRQANATSLDKMAFKSKKAVTDFLDNRVEPVVRPIFKGTQKASDTIRHYAGPHLGQSLDRTGQVAQMGPYYMPGLGDMLDVSTASVNAVNDWMGGDYWGAAGEAGLGLLSLAPGLTAAVVPMMKAGAHMGPDDVARMNRAQQIWDTAKTRNFSLIDDVARKMNLSPDIVTAMKSDNMLDDLARALEVDPDTGLLYFPNSPDGVQFWKEVDDYQMKPEAQTKFESDGRVRGKIGDVLEGPAMNANPAIADETIEMMNADHPMVQVLIDADREHRGGGYTPDFAARGRTNGKPRVKVTGYENEIEELFGHEMGHFNADVDGGFGGGSPRSVPKKLIAKTGYGDAFSAIFDPQGDWKARMGIYLDNSGENVSNAIGTRRKLFGPRRADKTGSFYDFMYMDQLDDKGGQMWKRPPTPLKNQWYRYHDTGSNSLIIGRIRPDGSNEVIDVMPLDQAKRGYGFAAETATQPPAAAKKGRGKISGLDPSTDELLRQAVSKPRKTIKGNYVGAPPGIGTPEAEQALVDRLKELALSEEGIKGRGFYRDFQNEIRRHTEDPVMARRFSSAGAHFSPNQTPFGETNHAFKAMNQYQLGHDVYAGGYPNQMSPRAEADFLRDTISADPKTGQYSYNKLPPEYRPADFTNYSAFPGRTDRPVHDVWDAAAMGYGDKTSGFTIPQHVFMDRLYKKAIHQLNRDPDVIARFGPRAFDNETLQEQVWRAIRMENGANETPPIREMFERNKGFTQMAAIPGPSTGVDPALLNAPIDVKRAYTDEMFKALSDESGGNIPARALGFSAPMEEGFGPWEGMLEPNRKIDLGVGASGSGAARAINPASAEAAQLMRDWNQIALGQEGAGFTMPREAGINVPDADIAYLKGAGLGTPEEYGRAFDAAQMQYGPLPARPTDAPWYDKVVVQPDDTGTLLKRIPEEGDFTFREGEYGPPGAEFRNRQHQRRAEGVGKQLGAIAMGRGRDAGNDFTYKRFDIPKGHPGSYHELFDATLANPRAKEIFDQKVQPLISKVQKAHELAMGKLGMQAGNAVIDRVRTIIGNAGKDWPRAIDEAVKKGIIPAFLVPVLLRETNGQLAGEEGVQ